MVTLAANRAATSAAGAIVSAPRSWTIEPVGLGAAGAPATGPPYASCTILPIIQSVLQPAQPSLGGSTRSIMCGPRRTWMATVVLVTSAAVAPPLCDQDLEPVSAQARTDPIVHVGVAHGSSSSRPTRMGSPRCRFKATGRSGPRKSASPHSRSAEEFDIAFTPVDPLQIIAVSVAPGSIPADGVTSLVVSAAVAAQSSRRAKNRGVPDDDRATPAVGGRGRRQQRRAGEPHEQRDGHGSYQRHGGRHDRRRRRHSSPRAAGPGALDRRRGGDQNRWSATIRATLLRSTGSVSPQLPVSYSATTSAGTAIGSFSRMTLAENGVSTATYGVGTTSYLAPSRSGRRSTAARPARPPSASSRNAAESMTNHPWRNNRSSARAETGH